MVSATFAAFAALSMPFIAIEFFSSLDLQSSVPSSSMTGHQDPTLDSAAVGLLPFQFQVVLLLVVTVGLFAAIAFIHLRLQKRATATATAAGADNSKRLSEFLTFSICATAGILEFVLFTARPAGAAVDDLGALVGRVAFGALPASATVVFFIGIALVIGHIRAGGEGGGGGDVPGNPRRVPLPVDDDDVLKKVALGAAGALLILIAISAIHVK